MQLRHLGQFRGLGAADGLGEFHRRGARLRHGEAAAAGGGQLEDDRLVPAGLVEAA
ncbi:hypothetical protein [Nonomuraea dietziae]|uniref:hypothetical protein n=1 Tax=Nonomuraea dietziae TaxID=65515 RepID=UPI0031D82CE9